MDKVSIIIIGYNVEKYIHQCLESVSSQLYKNIEIIFVDDGSVDNTAKIVLQAANLDKRIKYYRQKNSGANAARKYGFKKSTGKYILFVDGDDYLSSNTVSTCMKEIKYSRYDFICFDFYEFTSNGIVQKNHNYLVGKFQNEEFLESILMRRQAHYLWNKLFSSSFLSKMDFMNIPSITMGDDFCANIRMGVSCPNVKSIPNKFYYYRKSINSISRKVNEKYVELNCMMDDCEEQLKQYGMYNRYQELIEYNYFLNFYYYVVRNKYRYTWIQKSIYDKWKSKNILISKNAYIKEQMRNYSLLMKLLIIIIDKSDLLEIILPTIYAPYLKIIEKYKEK